MSGKKTKKNINLKTIYCPPIAVSSDYKKYILNERLCLQISPKYVVSVRTGKKQFMPVCIQKHVSAARRVGDTVVH
jgi:hypothetical protein